jgi:hypothetical protein
MSSLYDWKKKHFKSVPRELEKMRKELDELSSLADPESAAKKETLSRQMDELLYREEIMWLQRSRVAWLREGDRNTKYFHRRASWRRKKNRISKLKRPDGSWTMDTGEMEEMATGFLKIFIPGKKILIRQSSLTCYSRVLIMLLMIGYVRHSQKRKSAMLFSKLAP